MTHNEIYNTLRAAGIRYHSRSYQDYERAKKLLLSEPLSQYEYGVRLAAIVDYVGV